MVKKSTKKLLSLLLSAVMVIASVPFTSITALAVEPNISAANSALGNYATAMDGKKFVNMLPAYETYKTLKRYIDIYEVTGVDKGIDSLTNTLIQQYGNFSTFTSKQGTVTGSFHNDDKGYTTEQYQAVYKNLLYSPQTTGDCYAHPNKVQVHSQWNGTVTLQHWISYPNTVMLYDGIVTPYMPIVFSASAYCTNRTWNSSGTADDGCNITANGQGLALLEDWHGVDVGKDRNFMWLWYHTNDRKDLSCTSGISGSVPHSNWDKCNAYANIVKYDTDFQESEGYIKTINPTFTYWADNDGTRFAELTGQVTNATIYVINYKALLTAMKTTYAGKVTLKGSANTYYQGGLDGIIAAYNAAMSVDPTSSTYNFSNNVSNAANQLANDINNAINGTNGLKNSPATPDSPGYENLKTAVINAKNDYTVGMADPDIENVYAPGVWTTFKNAYEAAYGVFSGNTAYTPSGAATAATMASTLNDAKAALIVADRVDVSRLVIAIDNAQSVIDASRYFTTASYNASNIVNVLNAAKVAVWGSVDYYGVSSKLPADSVDSQQLVARHVQYLSASLAQLRINPDATTVASGESYNSAMAIYNSTYSNVPEHAATRKEYGNIGKLDTAVSVAQTYMADNTSIDATIEGHAHYVIESYAAAVNDIIFRIETLTPSFAIMPSGTIANVGTMQNTNVSSTHSGAEGFWQLNFDRYNGTILFKTNHLKESYKLPDATFTFSTNRTYTALLDSININADETMPTEELTSISSSQAVTDNATGWALNGAQCKQYAGLLSYQNGGLKLTYKNLRATSFAGNADAIGYTAIINGDNNTRQTIGKDRTDYVWDDLLLTTEGTEPISGGVICKTSSERVFGSVTLTADAEVETAATSSKLFDMDTATGEIYDLAENATVKLTTFDTSQSQSYLGMTYQWAYKPFNYFHGYSFDRTLYAQQMYVIDVSSLIDLINYCNGLDATQYSNTSWKDLVDAIDDASANIEYDSKTAAEIRSICAQRLENLFEKFMALEAPANNTSVHEALDLSVNAYRYDVSKCEPTTFAAFKSAYETLMQKYMKEYSDYNVRDFGEDDQDIIDAAAQVLVDAYNNLVYYADFTPVKNAIYLMASSIEDNKYSKADMAVLESAVASYSTEAWYRFYLNNKAVIDAYIENDTILDQNVIDQLKTYYDARGNVNFDDTQASITAVAQGIYALRETLGDGVDIGTQVLETEIDNIYAKYADPDAFKGVENAVAAIRAMNVYEPYNLYGVTKTVFAFTTEQEVQDAVTEILTQENYSITKQDYTVTMKYGQTTVNLGTYEYGTKIYIPANAASADDVLTDATDASFDSAPVRDWYYSYTSNTAHNGEKYAGSDKYLAFIVKGNTTLRVTDANDYSTTKVKVMFVNTLNGRPYKIEYVDPNTSITVSTSSAPKCSGYLCNLYQYKGGSSTNTINVGTENLIVYAKYTYATNATKYTVRLVNLDKNNTKATVDLNNLYYNDRITFSAEHSTTNKTPAAVCTKSGDNDEVQLATGYDRKIKLQAIKAWYVVKPEKMDAWAPFLDGATAHNTLTKIVQADTEGVLANSLECIAFTDGEYIDLNYRVYRDAIIIGASSAEIDKINGASMAGATNADGATASASKNIVKENGKMSIVSNYAIPQNATMVECGILFQSNGTAVAPSTPLTFQNVGKALNGDVKAVARMKSTIHTAGNQYVISIGTSSLSGAVAMQYAAYVIYEINGEQYSFIQPAQSVVESF